MFKFGKVLEVFDCYFDSIHGSIAHITMISRTNGDELAGQYEAKKLTKKGINVGDDFICKTVKVFNYSRIDIEKGENV